MDAIRVEVTDGVGVLTFDDGKVNAISLEVIAASKEALDALETDESVRAVVFTGRPGQFCAGFHLPTLMAGGESRNALITGGWDLMKRLFSFPKPLVVACTGNAIAGGAGLVLTGDVRLGAEGEFKIGFNEVGIGLPIPATMLTLVVERLVSRAHFEATAGARIYGPDEAAAVGYFDQLVAPDVLHDAALAEATRLSALAGDAFRMTKEAVVRPVLEQMAQVLPSDMEMLASIGG